MSTPAFEAEPDGRQAPLIHALIIRWEPDEEAPDRWRVWTESDSWVSPFEEAGVLRKAFNQSWEACYPEEYRDVIDDD